ncbi:hypothetical protein K469DRAFT_698135 [Zopfia rhizophila CBS 207.26]|uniref:Uncharacterized protein n=1 Tax=Zopfia rhizophila CBS 207.26 TaxID=1314779 RepID=A0A6A6DEI0_9PEZI|nr:hypothetical protein K469DRAFT_698135 [Zopfia rhizophila CBS 207.26]
MPMTPRSKVWPNASLDKKTSRTNLIQSGEIYCDASRISTSKNDKNVDTGKDPAHGNREFRGENLEAYAMCDDPNLPEKDRIRVFTVSSDLVDKGARKEAKRRGETLTPNSYTIETEYANTMQICRKTIDIASNDNWPDIDDSRIKKLTHTNQAGKSFHLETASGKVAYGWKRCGSVENPENEDTITLLALALKVWSVGKYYVKDDGGISSRFTIRQEVLNAKPRTLAVPDGAFSKDARNFWVR